MRWMAPFWQALLAGSLASGQPDRLFLSVARPPPRRQMAVEFDRRADTREIWHW